MGAVELSHGGWTAALGGSLILHAVLAATVMPLLDHAQTEKAVTEITFSAPEIESLAGPQGSEAISRASSSNDAAALEGATNAHSIEALSADTLTGVDTRVAASSPNDAEPLTAVPGDPAIPPLRGAIQQAVAAQEEILRRLPTDLAPKLSTESIAGLANAQASVAPAQNSHTAAPADVPSPSLQATKADVPMAAIGSDEAFSPASDAAVARPVSSASPAVASDAAAATQVAAVDEASRMQPESAAGVPSRAVARSEALSAAPPSASDAALARPVVTSARPSVVVMREIASVPVAAGSGGVKNPVEASVNLPPLPAERAGSGQGVSALASAASLPPARPSTAVAASIPRPVVPAASGGSMTVLPQLPAIPDDGGNGRGSAAWRRAVDFVRGFGGDGCFAAIPVETGERVGLQAFGADAGEVRRFVEDSARALQRPTDVQRGNLANIQCGALQLARSSKLYPDFALSIALDAPDEEDESVTGEILGAGSRAVHLLLIDETGMVQTVERFGQGPSTPLAFDLPFGREELAQARGLFLAVASDKRLWNLDFDIRMQAPEFFRLLQSESEREDATLDIAVTAFDLGARDPSRTSGLRSGN